MKRGKSPCYFVNLRRAAGAVTRLYDRRLAPLGLSINQFSMMANLDALGCVSVSALAVHMGLDRTTLVRNLKPLLDRGLVRDAAESGRRDRKLELTEEARDMMPNAYRAWKGAQQAVKDHLGPENVRLLMTMLEQIEELDEKEREEI